MDEELQQKMDEISNKPIGLFVDSTGLSISYKQWLVGQCLSGAAYSDRAYTDIARASMEQVHAVIHRLALLELERVK